MTYLHRLVLTRGYIGMLISDQSEILTQNGYYELQIPLNGLS